MLQKFPSAITALDPALQQQQQQDAEQDNDPQQQQQQPAASAGDRPCLTTPALLLCAGTHSTQTACTSALNYSRTNSLNHRGSVQPSKQASLATP